MAGSVLILLLPLLTSTQGVLPSRELILKRAESFASLTWFADSANTSDWDTAYYRWGFASHGCEEHRSSDWTAGETYQGIPYSYGGNDDTVRYISKLEDDSLGAGNHMCHYYNYGEATGIYPPDWTAGIDCSAFVCRTWGIPRTNVDGVYSRSYKIEKSQVKPGDALAYLGHHIVLVADPGPNPPYGTFALYEASGSACRAWYNPAASWSAYSKYYAVSLYKPERPDTTPEDTLRSRIFCEPSVAFGSVLIRFPNGWSESSVHYEIFNTAGQKITSGDVAAPDFELSWQARDDFGRKVPSGVYAVRITYPARSSFKRFIIIN